MSHNLFEEIKETVEETFSDDELILAGHHPRLARTFLYIRNLTVALAAILFIFSMFFISVRYTLKAIAYFLGAVAYCCEYLLLTDFFKTKIPHSEMFMVYCFGPLYLLLGISYILH